VTCHAIFFFFAIWKKIVIDQMPSNCCWN